MLARTVSTVIIVSMIIFAIFKPSLNWIIKLLGLILTVVGTLETVNLIKKIKLKPVFFVSLISAITIFYDGAFYNFRHIMPLLTFAILFAFIIQLIYYKEQNAIANVSTMIFASLYVSIPMALFFVILNSFPDKIQAGCIAVFLLAVVWMADSGAYLVGTFFGRHKLAPKLSPKKTIEGFFGGIAGSVLSGIILYFTMGSLNRFFASGALEVIVVSVILSLACQIGDLAESALKRDAGVKDSGRTFTGHGGVLDMVDGLLFCIPIFYIYIRWGYSLS